MFRHAATEGPGYFAEFLDECAIPWQLICIDAGETVPQGAGAYSGLVFMGGPMSVNDDLPWITQALALIRGAVAQDIPVLGHCLGGQLIARALGGAVTRNPVKEIGWGEVAVADNDAARAWFGETRSFEAFHWHGETFSLPQGAVHLLSSSHCVNQAFALGKHLALQCHVEMTEEELIEAILRGEKTRSDWEAPSGEKGAEVIGGMLHNQHRGIESGVIYNRGAIANLPFECAVEVPILVDAAGVHPVAIGNLPDGIARLLAIQVSVQQMAVEAAVHASKELALQALLIDPVINSASAAEKILDDLPEPV